MKAAIIGFGKVARNAHLPAFRELGLTIIGVADSSKRTLKLAHKKGLKCFTDYRELLKENLDLVSICTPAFLHPEMCIDVAESGANILVEKPLSLSVDEALKIKKKAESENIKLCVVHNYKFLEPLRKAKAMYDKGEIGRLLSIHTLTHHSSPPAHKTWKIDETKAGSILFEWIHPIYLQLWFGGAAKSVFAIGNKVATNYPLIRNVNALIEFENCTGYLEMSQFCSAPLFALNVIGTGASVTAKLPATFRIQAPATPIEACEEVISSLSDVVKLGQMFMSMRKPYMKYSWGSHFSLIKKYVESIRNDSEIPVPIDEGINSIKLAKAIENSLNIGKKVVL